MNVIDPSTARPFAEMILSGAFDDHLDIIGEALRNRNKAIQAQAASMFMKHDYVRFVKDESMEGITGTVSKVGSRITVLIEVPGGRRLRPRSRKYFETGQEWVVPATWLVKTTPPVAS